MISTPLQTNNKENTFDGLKTNGKKTIKKSILTTNTKLKSNIQFQNVKDTPTCNKTPLMTGKKLRPLGEKTNVLDSMVKQSTTKLLQSKKSKKVSDLFNDKIGMKVYKDKENTIDKEYVVEYAPPPVKEIPWCPPIQDQELFENIELPRPIFLSHSEMELGIAKKIHNHEYDFEPLCPPVNMDFYKLADDGMDTFIEGLDFVTLDLDLNSESLII
ncbi:hypothetical protein BC833DRAFT_617409 [Globomyces pollinis-pini]|nr:hypothetical protein BC833DRAFT_617409 [Globomyces pollinis-pini]